MSPYRTAGLAALCVAMMSFASEATAQRRQIPSVVQLPSFQTFSYTGSVMVPDSGGAYLGGNRRSSSGLNRRGLSRGFGSALGNSQASIRATIIDQLKMDRQLLGADPAEIRAQAGRQNVAGVNPIDPDAEGKALVRFARAQYRAGNDGVAFDSYRMAIDVLNGQLKDLATKEFRRVFGTAAEHSLRMAARQTR